MKIVHRVTHRMPVKSEVISSICLKFTALSCLFSMRFRNRPRNKVNLDQPALLSYVRVRQWMWSRIVYVGAAVSTTPRTALLLCFRVKRSDYQTWITARPTPNILLMATEISSKRRNWAEWVMRILAQSSPSLVTIEIKTCQVSHMVAGSGN